MKTVERSVSSITTPDLLEVFEIPDLLEHLKQKDDWMNEKSSSLTLHKDGKMSIVLVAMRGSASIGEHRAQGPITVQVVEGRLRVNTDKESVNVGQNEIVTLPAGLKHSLDALEDCGFLLTFGSGHSYFEAAR